MLPDFTATPTQELLSDLRGSFEEAAKLGLLQVEVDLAVLDELERRLLAADDDPFVLPAAVTDAIRSNFGGGDRTFKAITRRVRFAYKVWQGKYGPWTPEQAEYAEELVVWAINYANRGTDPSHARALVYTQLDRIVNHENTHEGFKRRAEEGMDISEELRTILG